MKDGFKARLSVRFFAALLVVGFFMLHDTPGPGSMARGSVATGHEARAIVAALVLPRLSLQCIVAVVDAIRTCGSPAPGGVVACGLAVVRILRVCP